MSNINFDRIILKCLPERIKDDMSDEIYLKLRYKARLGKVLNLEKPRRFNEKLQWLKLHDRNELYPKMVDKYEVKKQVAELLGERYIIPTLGVWDSFEEINFELLPNQFVLKTTHDSGGVVICKDKSNFDLKRSKAIIDKSMNTNYFYHGREWPYLSIKPRIISEVYMEESGINELRDYKVFVFNGIPHYIQVDYNRFTNHKRNFYTTDWKYVPFTTCYPTDMDYVVKKPDCLEELLELSQRLAKGLNNPPFIRTDFYIINNQIYFGEITFYHGSGCEQFYPDEYDLILGDLIDLDNVNEYGIDNYTKR